MWRRYIVYKGHDTSTNWQLTAGRTSHAVTVSKKCLHLSKSFKRCRICFISDQTMHQPLVIGRKKKRKKETTHGITERVVETSLQSRHPGSRQLESDSWEELLQPVTATDRCSPAISHHACVRTGTTPASGLAPRLRVPQHGRAAASQPCGNGHLAGRSSPFFSFCIFF